MEEKDSKFVDWINSMTMTQAINSLILTAFILIILILVVRTFRNKPSA